jgi:hypothetical protein
MLDYMKRQLQNADRFLIIIENEYYGEKERCDIVKERFA